MAAGTLQNSDPTVYLGATQVPTFAQYNPAAYKALKKSYLPYIKHIAAIEKGTEIPNQIGKFTVADLTYEPSGLPRVPAAIKNINGIETSLMQQQILRAYLKKHYSESRFKWH